MKKTKLFTAFLLFFAQTTNATNNPQVNFIHINANCLLQQAALLEPILVHSHGQAVYDRFLQTVEKLLQFQHNLVTTCALDPTTQEEQQLDMINAVLAYIYNCTQELNLMKANKNNYDPNNPYNQYQNPNNQYPDPQQIAQAQQQQVINNLISAIDQSNYTIEKLTRPNRMKYIKIGAYLLFGVAIVVGVGALFLGIYRGVYAIIKEPMETINDEQRDLVGQAAGIGNKIEKDVTELQEDIDPVARNTEDIKSNIKHSLEILANMTENEIPKMKRKTDDKIAIFRMLIELRNLRQKTIEKIEELDEEIRIVKNQQQTERRTNQLQSQQIVRLQKEQIHMRRKSKRINSFCATCDEMLDENTDDTQ